MSIFIISSLTQNVLLFFRLAAKFKINLLLELLSGMSFR